VDSCRGRYRWPAVDSPAGIAATWLTSRSAASCWAISERIEEGFGGAKTIGGLRKLKHRGQAKGEFQLTLNFTAKNLVRS